MTQGSRQRRAIYTVLQQWLDEDQLQEALLVFIDRYQGKPSIGMHDYLADIAPLYAEKVDPKTLRRELMRMLVANDQVLAPDPMPSLEPLRARGELAASQPSLEQLALHEVVSRVVQGVSRGDRRVFHERVALQLRSSFVNCRYDALAQYMLSVDPKHILGLDQTTLREFFTLFYSACCEAFGPVEADGRLAEALAQLKARSPRARVAFDGLL